MHLHNLVPRRTFPDGPLPSYQRRALYDLAAPLVLVFTLAFFAMLYWLLIGSPLWQRQQAKDARDYKLGLEEAAMRMRQVIVAQEARSHIFPGRRFDSQDDIISPLHRQHYRNDMTASSATLLAGHMMAPLPFQRSSHAYPPTPQFEAKDPTSSISSGSGSQEASPSSRVTSLGAFSQRSSAELLRDSLLPSLNGAGANARSRRIRPIYGSEFSDVRMTMSWQRRQPSLDQTVRLSVAPARHYPPPTGANALQVGGHGRRPSISSVRSHGTSSDRRSISSSVRGGVDRRSIVSSVRGGVRDSAARPPGIRSSLRGAPMLTVPHIRNGQASILGRSISSRSGAARTSQLHPSLDGLKNISAISLPLSRTHSEGSHEAAPPPQPKLQPMQFHRPPVSAATTRPGLVQRSGSEAGSYSALPLGSAVDGAGVFAKPGTAVALSRAPSSSDSSNDTVLSQRFAMSDSTTHLAGDTSGISTQARSHPLEPYRPTAPGRFL